MYRVRVSSEYFIKLVTQGAMIEPFKVVQGLPVGCALELVRFKERNGIIEMFFSGPEKSGDIKECQIKLESLRPTK